ncbi:MAG: bifunctional demethylmenaquinone methyltransferase/2-methoxy-6-polyprenyl-1,4-benzoquinol methylase UbiE [Flavobacteriales bacterium]|nr:bifunctional demethylmenaquinone methyltransferase/2-methoxy-6-polyprenyl-1,4-benzoquinol methylase UbiE [Flavobacteriales bacterium]|tara:strand:- start:8533 stop:9252 length:720 start_codon:yes stop_codon:yes gene_type:complete
MKIIKPYNNKESKKKQISYMFDSISETYDFLNLILSLGMDKVWRKKAIQNIKNNPLKILDVATGTADLAILAAEKTNANIIGIDISEKMLEKASQKIKKKKLFNRVSLKLADAEKIPYKENSFQAITAGFGVRNFEDINLGLKEMYRVLEKKGVLVIIEPSKPTSFPINHIYNLYFNYILPLLGKFISRENHAYKYFIESVNEFDSSNNLMKNLKKIGFKNCKKTELNFGIVSLYTATK